ncbi:MAG: hypothetical protein R3D98_01475 [Candidatus Krumholzibacteriia bacterium]
MITIGFGAWLVTAVLLFTGGFLAAVIGPPAARRTVALVAMLGGAVLAVAAMVRHQILDGGGPGLALVIVCGGLALLSLASAPDRGGEP